MGDNNRSLWDNNFRPITTTIIKKLDYARKHEYLHIFIYYLYLIQ